jgi:hypothetical protein
MKWKAITMNGNFNSENILSAFSLDWWLLERIIAVSHFFSPLLGSLFVFNASLSNSFGSNYLVVKYFPLIKQIWNNFEDICQLRFVLRMLQMTGAIDLDTAMMIINSSQFGNSTL